MTDDIRDSLFHGCALRAYLEIYAQTRQFPPDSEATRLRAYQLYEQALAEKNRRKQLQDNGRSPRREAGQGCEAPKGSGGAARLSHPARYFAQLPAADQPHTPDAAGFDKTVKER